MRRLAIVCELLLVACKPASRPERVDSAAAVAALRDTLVRFGEEDQRGRDSIGVAVARNDSVFIRRIMHADSMRTAWLRTQVAAHGWPKRALVGDTAAMAAWLIVQHSADQAFQAQMLSTLQQSANAGNVPAGDVAMLADRIAVHEGRAQRYGTQFSFHNGTLIPDSIADVASLDSLRATVGLPPMREYAKQLADAFHQPVEWPPRRR